MMWVILGILGGLVGGILIGSNNPQWFKRNRKALERIAENLLAKAKELTLRGKG